MSRYHFVTGATGFVGGAISLELLRHTDCVVICGARGESDEHAQQRVTTALCEAARAYDLHDLTKEIERRVIGVRADIGQEIDPGAATRITNGEPLTVWHSAASLKYKETDRAEIFSDNLNGTRNVMEFALASNVEVVNYLSTAYVSGNLQGKIFERNVEDNGGAPCNCYEESKIASEKLLRTYTQLHSRIFRPGVVIGHSKTRKATSFSGLYGFIRDLKMFNRRISRKLGAFYSHRAVCLVANPEANINFIPIDAVAQNIVKLGTSGTSDRVFHITNTAPPPVGRSLIQFFGDIGMQEPRFVPNRTYLTSIDEALNDELDFYSSYLSIPKSFDVENGAKILGGEAFHWPIDEKELRNYYGWYIEHLEKQGISNRLGSAKTASKRASAAGRAATEAQA